MSGRKSGSQTQARGHAKGPARGGARRKPRTGARVKTKLDPRAEVRRHARGAAETRRHARGAAETRRDARGAPEAARGRAAPRASAEPTPRQGGLPLRDPARDRELAQLMAANAPPSPGEWLWTTREGAERDCVEELLLRRAGAPALKARGYAPGLVVSTRAVRDAQGRLELTFARQGFAVEAQSRDLDESTLAAAFARAAALLVRGDRYAVQVFVPDTEVGNRLSQRAERICAQLGSQLAAALPGAQQLDASDLRRNAAELVQVCICAPDLAVLGVLPSDQALSIWPGGRARMKLSADRPSRSARKLEEALAWLGMSPDPGELCVDLGAAPGGWSWLLLNRRARVIAVDPARLDPQLLSQRRLRHVQGNAFDWQPEEPVDWLFCDMAYRPLEVAQMLGRWARRKQTRMLVANFKLPMKRKAEMVERLRELLAASGYKQLRTRQLYHDREEITLTARI